MLRLAHPAPRGQGTDPPKRRKWSRPAALSLTPEEVRHVRATLANVTRAYGGTDVLAAVMGVPSRYLYSIARSRKPSGILAIRLAGAAGITVETMLAGKLATAPAPRPNAPGGAA